MGLFAWGHIWIYLVANFAGAAAAAFAFRLTQPVDALGAGAPVLRRFPRRRPLREAPDRAHSV
jgi:hypothetical protein